ncbi:hypothetical protein vseg_003316 [Gypsophila vaccaria]
MEDMVIENKGTQTKLITEISRSDNDSSNDDVKDRSKLRKIRRKQVHMKKNKRVLMKRRRISGSSRGCARGEEGIERRVRTLKQLIPKPENQGLEGLFRDAASYIMSLQMRVRVMRLMLHILSTSSQQHH